MTIPPGGQADILKGSGQGTETPAGAGYIGGARWGLCVLGEHSVFTTWLHPAFCLSSHHTGVAIGCEGGSRPWWTCKAHGESRGDSRGHSEPSLVHWLGPPLAPRKRHASWKAALSRPHPPSGQRGLGDPKLLSQPSSSMCPRDPYTRLYLDLQSGLLAYPPPAHAGL